MKIENEKNWKEEYLEKYKLTLNDKIEYYDYVQSLPVGNGSIKTYIDFVKALRMDNASVLKDEKSNEDLAIAIANGVALNNDALNLKALNHCLSFDDDLVLAAVIRAGLDVEGTFKQHDMSIVQEAVLSGSPKCLKMFAANDYNFHDIPNCNSLWMDAAYLPNKTVFEILAGENVTEKNNKIPSMAYAFNCIDDTIILLENDKAVEDYSNQQSRLLQNELNKLYLCKDILETHIILNGSDLDREKIGCSDCDIFCEREN